MAGTVNKKGEFNAAKALASLPHLVPTEMMEASKRSVEACRDARKYSQLFKALSRVLYIVQCLQIKLSRNRAKGSSKQPSAWLKTAKESLCGLRTIG